MSEDSDWRLWLTYLPDSSISNIFLMSYKVLDLSLKKEGIGSYQRAWLPSPQWAKSKGRPCKRQLTRGGSLCPNWDQDNSRIVVGNYSLEIEV